VVVMVGVCTCVGACGWGCVYVSLDGIVENETEVMLPCCRFCIEVNGPSCTGQFETLLVAGTVSGMTVGLYG
jgi:hypothetical protein